MSKSKPFHWLRILPFLFLGLFLYSNTLDVPFYFDDIQNIEKNAHIRLDRLTLEGLSGAAFKSYASRRPVANISFALNYYLHGYDLAGYHAVNIVIHILTGIFVYLLMEASLGLLPPGSPVFRFSDSANPPHCFQAAQRRNCSIIALFGALLWFVHPIQTQSVTYIVQRMNAMAAMFYVLSLVLYVKGRLSAVGARRWVWFSGSFVAAGLALGSKEISATLPFFILLYEWYFFQDLSKTWFKKYLLYLLCAFVAFAIIAWLYLGSDPLHAVLSGYKNRDFTLVERVFTEFRVVVYYMSLLVYPNPSRLNLDYDFALSQSLSQPLTTIVSLVLIVALIVFAALAAKRYRLVSFAILWFFGNLAIESSVFSLELVYEHRTYLPSMFLFLTFVWLLYGYIGNAKAVGAVICAIMVLFCFWTHGRTWAECRLG